MKCVKQIGDIGLRLDQSKDDVVLITDDKEISLSVAEVHLMVENLHSWLHYRMFGLPESVDAVSHYLTLKKQGQTEY